MPAPCAPLHERQRALELVVLARDLLDAVVAGWAGRGRC